MFGKTHDPGLERADLLLQALADGEKRRDSVLTPNIAGDQLTHFVSPVAHLPDNLANVLSRPRILHWHGSWPRCCIGFGRTGREDGEAGSAAVAGAIPRLRPVDCSTTPLTA